MTENEWEHFWFVHEATTLRQVSESDDTASCVSGDDEQAWVDPIAQGAARLQLAVARSVPATTAGTPSRVNPPAPAATARTPSARKPQRLNRCGSCIGCESKDCGMCKNCADKPRFGGPGIKKKACIARICQQPKQQSADEMSDHDSPQAQCPTCPVLATADQSQRQPMVTLEMHGSAQPTLAIASMATFNASTATLAS